MRPYQSRREASASRHGLSNSDGLRESCEESCEERKLASTPVQRDQFKISSKGITHKPRRLYKLLTAPPIVKSRVFGVLQ
jgi:hypothetical protein